MSLFRAATRLSRPVSSAGHRRFGAQAEVEYEGFEKTVRTYLPKDEHVVFGILGMYVGLYFVGKGVSALTSGGAKEEVRREEERKPTGCFWHEERAKDEKSPLEGITSNSNRRLL